MLKEETNTIKCLMIGSEGIGKTEFLRKFPNSKQTDCDHMEKFTMECINEAKLKKLKKKSMPNTTTNIDYLKVDVDNYDITDETLFIHNENDFQLNTKIINTFKYKVIILCFAMDDRNSFDLIKSKWMLYLRKTRTHHHVILVALKCDRKLCTPKNYGYKYQRSESLSSNSSTSILHIKNNNNNNITAPIRKRTLSDNYDLEFQQVFGYECRKFANKISDYKIIQSCSLDLNNTNDLFRITKNSIESYVNLSKSLCKCYMNKKSFTTISNESSKFVLPKQLTVPINFLKNKINLSKKDKNQIIAYEKHDSNNENVKLTLNNKLNETISLKNKFSQVFLGLGTYLVTCGTGKSRQLKINLNKKINNTTNTLVKSNLVKKDKSWLLLASEASLNNLENDEVFY